MTGLEQLQYLSWLLYLLVFIAVLLRTVRRPTPAHIDMTLFFGDVAIVIVLSTLTSKLRLPQPTWEPYVAGAAIIALGYLLLRLVRDFRDVPTWLVRLVEAGMVLSIGAFVLVPPPLPPSAALAIVTYLVLVIGYDTWAFARHARRSRGVTRRRMQATAGGSLCLSLVLVIAGAGLVAPEWAAVWSELSAVLGLASGACYFVGFAPPTWLRRAWQEPEVRAFLGRAGSLPRLPDTRSIVHELEASAADAFGAAAASIALWDPDSRRLRAFYKPPVAQSDDAVVEKVPASVREAGVWEFEPAARPIAGRAFLDQKASLIQNASRVDPENTRLRELYGARSMLSAPITAGDKRLGVLVVFAPRAPVFANSDLELVQLLADQAAVILESRALIDEAARVHAREEAARLKEDFLSSAAHDLKTPLTGIVTQAQVLRRRAERNPTAPVDRVGLDRLVEQSQRLKDLVLKLLDASRLEHGGLLGERETVDLYELVRADIRRESAAWARVKLEPGESVFADVDGLRFEQVLTNLVENALKYSPADQLVTVRVWQTDGQARLEVEDRGVGIPLDDQPLIFERFHRARNVDDRQFAGMGLGLFIARGIVEEHGGRIWVESSPGRGSKFSVAVPALSPVEAEAVDDVPVAEKTPSHG